MPWDGGTQRLARLVGRAKALELILLGETIDAPEAHRIGLVHKVISHDELMTVVMDLAQKMAAKSSVSLAYVKEAIHKGMDLTLEQGLRLEADLYYLMHTTKDRTEGIKAFREKRQPQFKGK
jgi:enoyl-CoA hydratase/carnithine racemase